MEKNATSLQTMYRKVFETEISQGTDIISSKSLRRDNSPFASVDKVIETLESLDTPGAYAA